jgi:hypothetical protein
MSRPSRGPSVVRKRSCNDWEFLDSRGRSWRFVPRCGRTPSVEDNSNGLFAYVQAGERAERFAIGRMVVVGIRFHPGHIAEHHGLIGLFVLVSPETTLPFRIRTPPPFLAGILQGP